MTETNEKTEAEQDEEFELVVTIIVIVAALFFGYKNRNKISQKIKTILESLK